MALVIADAREEEAPIVLDFIRRLADYEKMSDEVVATEADIREALFGERAVAECLIARADERPVGFALYFRNFSTFAGKPGLYLEDLFVAPEERGKGYGKALLRRLARIAKERGYGRFEWSVLNWNRPAIDFYESLGAKPQDEWTVFRVDGAALERLAE